MLRGCGYPSINLEATRGLEIGKQSQVPFLDRDRGSCNRQQGRTAAASRIVAGKLEQFLVRRSLQAHVRALEIRRGLQVNEHHLLARTQGCRWEAVEPAAGEGQLRARALVIINYRRCEIPNSRRGGALQRELRRADDEKLDRAAALDECR